MQKTFTDFKNDFYKRVPDLTLFDCADFNLLKVVLDGLKVNYINKGEIRSSIFYPLFIYRGFLLLKRLFKPRSDERALKKFIEENRSKSILVHDTGRFIDNENPKSVRFENINNSLKGKAVRIYDTHFNLNQITAHYIFRNYEDLPLNIEEKLLRVELIRTFKRIKNSKLFNHSELQNIEFAVHKFFLEYKIWSRLLSELTQVEKCYLECHYHKEGEILALKRRGIYVIELQHGLISERDIFYVLPEKTKIVVHKCLFANEIFVFGEYWKKVLLKGAEYNDKSIKILGDYYYEGEQSYGEELQQIVKDRNALVVTTQTFMHDEFIGFIKKLSKNTNLFGNDILILIKPHPYEDVRVYEEAFKNDKNIVVVNLPVSALFKKIKTHISVYSTTLFDALRYDVVNYIFEVPQYMDYTEEILQLGIADKIDIEKDRIEKYRLQNSKAYYYEAFNPSLL